MQNELIQNWNSVENNLYIVGKSLKSVKNYLRQKNHRNTDHPTDMGGQSCNVLSRILTNFRLKLFRV